MVNPDRSSETGLEKLSRPVAGPSLHAAKAAGSGNRHGGPPISTTRSGNRHNLRLTALNQGSLAGATSNRESRLLSIRLPSAEPELKKLLQNQKENHGIELSACPRLSGTYVRRILILGFQVTNCPSQHSTPVLSVTQQGTRNQR